jgi:anti-sigma B factor antagonist
MNFATRDRNGARIVTALESRIDAAGAIAFKDSMMAACDGASGRVVLDLSRVDFLDSSGLGALVALRQLLGAARPMELAGLTPPVARVLRLTRMDTVFVIHAQAADAA